MVTFSRGTIYQNFNEMMLGAIILGTFEMALLKCATEFCTFDLFRKFDTSKISGVAVRITERALRTRVSF